MGETETHEGSLATHLGDERRVDCLNEGAQLRTDDRGVLDQSGSLDFAEHGIAGRGRKRVAPEGAAVLAGLEQLGCRAEGDECPDRHAAGDALREDEGIRHDIGLLESEPGARAADAGLDLVEDQQCAVLGGELSRATQEAVWQIEHAGLALDRLDEDRGNGVIHRRFEGRDGRVDVLDAGQQRLEGFAQRRFAGERKRSHRASVKGVDEGKNAGATTVATIEPRELDRRFDRLCPGIGEKYPPRIAGAGDAAQALGEFELRWGGEIVGDMSERRDLAAHSIHEHRMCVAERVNRDASEKVEIAVAVDIPHMCALAAFEHREGWCERAHHRVAEAFAPIVRVHHRSFPETTSVPIPSAVNASSRIECSTRPSMIAAFGTPPSTASRQAVILGIMPDSRDGSSTRNSVASRVEMRESRLGQSR